MSIQDAGRRRGAPVSSGAEHDPAIATEPAKTLSTTDTPLYVRATDAR